MATRKEFSKKRSKKRSGSRSLFCPNCSSDHSGVNDTRRFADNRVWRRRECIKCKKRFTTYEIHEQDYHELAELRKLMVTLKGPLTQAIKLVSND
jgi:hypothetical protein